MFQEKNNIIPYHEFIDQLYDGTIFIFKKIPQVLEFCQIVEQYITEFLNVDEPLSFHLNLEEEEYLEKTATLINAFQKEAGCQFAFKKILAGFSLDISKLFWDRLVLRIVLSGQLQDKAKFSKVGYHRDTWGSNIYNQVNWWLPVLPMKKETSTIVFYPKYWNQAIKNTTDTWRFSEYIAEFKKSKKLGLKISYPTTPQAIEKVDTNDACPIYIEPGDLLCFSSAHLHASSMNLSQFSRFSVETRTLLLSDIQQNKKAQNVDNQGTELMYQWFSSLDSSTALSKYFN